MIFPYRSIPVLGNEVVQTPKTHPQAKGSGPVLLQPTLAKKKRGGGPKGETMGMAIKMLLSSHFSDILSQV